MSHCSICNSDLHNGQSTVRLGLKGVETLNNAHDGKIIFQVGQSVHVDCRRDYCRDAKRKPRDPSSSAATSPAKTRSSLNQPRWNEDCFFCGNPAKYDGRKRGFDVIPVRTEVLQNSITEICKDRKDAWATVVLGRLEYARDLHAADAVYHSQCCVNFRTGKQIPRQHTSTPTENPAKRARHAGRPKNNLRTDAFLKVIEWLKSNDDEQTTVNDLCVKMKEYLEETEEAYSSVYMKSKLIEHLGERILITTIEGKSNVVTFQRTAASIINEFYYMPKQADVQTEKERIVAAAAQLIKSEIKDLQVAQGTYPSPEDMKSIDKAFEFIPNLLSSFLRSLFAGKAADLKIAALSQAIMQATRPRVIIAPLQLGLGVQMHHHFASRFLIDTLYSMGFCSSYSTIQKFERSAAVAQGTDIPGYTPGSFIQYVADNVDHNSRTLDGTGTFHGMGIIASITPATRFSRAIPRKSVTATDIASAGKVVIRQYHGPNEDATSLVYKTLKDLKVRDSTTNLDLLYKVTQTLVEISTASMVWSNADNSQERGLSRTIVSDVFADDRHGPKFYYTEVKKEVAVGQKNGPGTGRRSDLGGLEDERNLIKEMSVPLSLADFRPLN
ncbi:hypothetical protein AC249_AIPGENE6377 [Exaiptasia diaphana]|nr:hypothetical protein AC249_AIPGENE6377 [Exaiptasia diaphana]